MTSDYDSGVVGVGVADPGEVHGFTAPRTSFVGRAADVSKVAGLLGDFRLVTVTGPGGVGKTRLAGAVAQQVVARFADGVWVAELAATLDPNAVPGVVADALGLQLAPGVVLADVLRRRQLLVVLDNCEHVLDAAASLCESILAAADDVRILATSREPLGASGEARCRLGSLRLPVLDGEAPALGSAGPSVADAVTLFGDRARLADPGFAVDGESAPLVAQIVTALDGMPLAIELAAARVESLGVDQLAARLGDRLRLLTGSGRAAGGRHASLTAAADWSYRLLDEEQQRVFRALSVFPGPFTLEAAEAVAGSSAGPAVLQLVECSLIVPPRVGPDGRARYVLLETLRAFGSERLAEAGERDAAEVTLARYAVELAEAVAPGLQTTSGEVVALRWLDAEVGTLQHALAWALEHDDSLMARLAITLAPWWYIRSRWREGYVQLEEAAKRVGVGTELWCTAQLWLGRYSSNQTTGLMHASAAIDALTGSANAVLLALARALRARRLAYVNRFDEAVGEAQRALDAAVLLGNKGVEAAALEVLAWVRRAADGPQASLPWYRRMLAIDVADVPGWIALPCFIDFAMALGDLGEIAEARHHATRALAMARQAGYLGNEGFALLAIAQLEVKDGDLAAARTHLREAIDLSSRGGHAALLIEILRCAVIVSRRSERWREAVTLQAAWEATKEVTTQAVYPGDDKPTRAAWAAQAALSSADAHAAKQRGAAMTPDAAAAYALEVLADKPVGRGNGELSGGPPLSARERELVLLVAQGRTDAQIAAELFISIRTVRSHLDRIRDKTGCRRRADLTRLALQAGLI